MQFNKNIQGMRAVAVLAVVLMHLSVSWLPGGFVGVDIFFVISGYLITGLLVREYERTGSISFTAFYGRRVRRLFPAMLVTCLFTLVGGFLLLPDERFDFLLDSTLAAFFSVSNIYFWSQVGYFDTESVFKPLLHTWSLGVEEQFYLIWPLVMLGLMRYYKAYGIVFSLLVLSASSFAINMLFIDFDIGDKLSEAGSLLSGFLDGGSTAFYLMPFRIFEFGIGALLFFVHPRVNKVNSLVAEVIALSALVGLALFMINLNEHSVFPYYNALGVAALTAVIIAFSGRAGFTTLLLSNPVMVFIGGISYSLYLVHWPLIVYYQALFGEITIVSLVVLMAVMLVLGYMLHVLVEERFRHARPSINSSSRLVFMFSRRGLLVALILSVATVFVLRGVEGRVPENRLVVSNADWRNIEKKTYCQNDIEGFSSALFTCQNDRRADATIVIWGDSHALHLIAGVSEVFPDHNIAVAYMSGCISQSGFNGLLREFTSELLTNACAERNDSFMQWAAGYKGDLTIFISNAKRNQPAQIAKINNDHVNRLETMGHKAYVMGDFIRPGVELAQCYSVPNYIFSEQMLRRRCAHDELEEARELGYSQELAELSNNYISVHAVQCPDGKCRFSDEAGRVSFRDTHHLSVPGSIYWISKLKESGMLSWPEFAKVY